FGALRELVLLAGQPARGVLIAARDGASGLFADLPLARGKLARFELRVAHGAAPFVGPGLAERALHALQPLERTRALTARGVRILATKLARRAAHVLGGLPQFGRLLALLAPARPRLPLLALLALPASLGLLAPLALLALPPLVLLHLLSEQLGL